MLKKLPIGLIRILTVVFTTFLCLLIVGNEVAGAYAPTINHALNIKSFKVVNSDDDTDAIYFKSEYSENTVDGSGNPVYTQDGVDRLKKDADEACSEIEGEGLVLMKNDGALPLSSGGKVSLFGQGSVIFNYGSSGSSATNTAGYTDFKTALESEGLNVNADLWNFYSSGAGKDYVRNMSSINEAPWSLVSGNNASGFSSFGDAAIVVISRNSGEGTDVPTTGSDGIGGNYLALSQNERDMLVGLTDLKKSNVFKKIVVILNSASPIQLDFLSAEGIGVDACMWVGNVGRTGIYAVAKALSGKIVPSGRLSDTYVYDNFSSPAMASWMLTGNKRFAQSYQNYSDFKVGGLNLNGTQYHYGVYVEGVYVGYRYYETRYEDVVLKAEKVGDYDYGKVVAYPFGHGLSYASFDYDEFSVTEKEDAFEVSVKVTNVSEAFDGKEVVQIYLQKPYDKASGVETPSVELVGYAKTGVLTKNGGSETVKITVKKEQLTSYDVGASGGRGGYVLSKGDFYITVGKDAHDALNNVLSKKALSGVTVDQTKMTATGNADLTFKWTKTAHDEVSFAASKETNNLIVNQLDFADINRYQNRGDNGVTYLSRGDWTGTWPKKAVTLTLNQSMADDLGIHKELPTETDEEMPVYGADNGMSLIMLRSSKDNIIDYNSAAWESFLDQMTFEQQALLLTNAAFGTVALEAPFNKPATKDNDGPTGVVRSATGISFPSEGIWASSFNVGLIEKVGGLLAEDALYNGYQCLYATGINIHRTPYGGRAHEYFSEDPFLTGYSVMYEVKGMQDKGVIPTLKHYAFNDEEDQRGGIGIWLNEQEAREIMLKPFEMAMRPSMGNAHGLMTSFNRAGCIWTSASSELMINIARKEWGFDGYSITDMAESFKFYMTYDDGIMNGTDTYLAADNEYALSDYAYSIPFRLRMREACHRVLYTIANHSAAMNGLSASSRIIPLTPWWQSTVYAGIGVFGGLCAVGVGLWITYYVLAIIKKKK
jgi:beta-glucosidase